LVYSVSRSLGFAYGPQDVESIQSAARQLTEYVTDLLGSREALLRHDFLKTYSSTVTAAGNLTPAEILSQIVTVIIAGSDTTRGTIAVQTSLLLQHRDQWDAVCADPALIPGAGSESLRFEPVVGSSVNRHHCKDTAEYAE